MAASLGDCRVLVTRPVDRAAELLSALREQGAFCLHRPLLDIAPLADDAPELLRCRRYIADLAHYQRLIFISVNAVSHGLYEIDRVWPQWPQGLRVYAIGEATAKALLNSTLPVNSGLLLASGADDDGAMNTEALLNHPDLQQLENEKILIFRGVAGREQLAVSLRQRGAHVDYGECYRRSETACDAGDFRALLLQNDINTVCLNSGETLAHFGNLVSGSRALCDLRLVVPSQRVADQARSMGFDNIIQAQNAGTAATVAALQLSTAGSSEFH